jgi:hypothetical protein
MTTRKQIALALAWIALVGLAGYETRVVFQQREELRAVRQGFDRLAADIAQFRGARDSAARELAEAEQQLAALPALRPEEASLPAGRREEINTWLARVRRLRQIFDERPDQRIPEMPLLKDEDWLRVARNATLDSEDGVRKGLAGIRSAAIARLGSQFSSALKKFATAANPETSATIFALAPYMEHAVDATLLERYELKKSTTSRGDSEWIVQNKTPIDADYDSRYQLKASSNGSFSGGSLYGPMAWIPDFNERLLRATKDYRQANQNVPPADMADVLPFFTPPLDPATAEKVIRALRERGP